MAANDFNKNPCRQTIFDLFDLDKSETDVKKILDAIHTAQDKQKGRESFRAADGTEFTLTEAELNAQEKILLDPVERLKAEQFVHQAHLFTNDQELSECMNRLEGKDDAMGDLLSGIQIALLSIVGRFLPEMTPPTLEDDIEWPDAPPPFPVSIEPLETAILREG